MTSISETPILGCWLITTDKFVDDRGSFREWLPSQACQEILGEDFVVAQANYSISKKGTIRGIHYSLEPKGQTKIITCLSGSIFDVVVDLRADSPTFAHWFGVELSSELGNSLYVGNGLGHAFMALEENTGVAYLQSTPYRPSMESGISPFDSDIGIKWPKGPYFLSVKDQTAPSFKKQKNTHL